MMIELKVAASSQEEYFGEFEPTHCMLKLTDVESTSNGSDVNVRFSLPLMYCISMVRFLYLTKFLFSTINGAS